MIMLIDVIIHSFLLLRLDNCIVTLLQFFIIALMVCTNKPVARF